MSRRTPVFGPLRPLSRLLAVAFLALTALSGPGQVAAAEVRLRGAVVDRDGRPIELVTVAVPALHRGALTDTAGRFSLDLPAGTATLECSQIGYEHARIAITVDEGSAPLRIVLHDEPVQLAEVAVATSAFGKLGKGEGATLRRVDVYTTPGGAADLFQSLRALPGINAPAEGAAIYVRGGPPHETLVRLDGGEMGHPYHFERASGGLFSALDGYLVRGAFFSSGGFSAKYGGVLSGVLDIETIDPANLRTVSVGANLAGAGASTTWALLPDRLSATGSMRYSYPEMLFRLYGSADEYESAPSSHDAAGKLLYRYSATGRLALLYLDSRDRLAVVANHLNVKDTYREITTSQLAALQFEDVAAGRVALRGQASGQYYDTEWSFGPSSAGQTERNAQANLDGVWPLSPHHELSFGANYRRDDVAIVGQLAADSTDFGPGAPTRPYDTRPRVAYPGVYLQDKLRLWGPLYATLGGRLDYASTPGVWTVDPRAALAWRLDEHQTLRLAAGRYHQLAEPRFLDPVYGNPRLGPLTAQHLIAGYEWLSEFGNVRLEAYRKNYRELITNTAATFYDNGGHGYAQGVDVLVKGTYRWLSGWVSYGYLDSKRRELDDPYPVPSSYGVPHSLTLVSTYQWSSTWQLGARYGHSSGRPYTPVVGRSYDPIRGIWRPTFGANNSGSMPEYRRLDLRITKLFSLPAGWGLPASSICVVYVEGLNVLGIPNVLEYVYNGDYSQRYERASYFGRRLLVGGFLLTW